MADWRDEIERAKEDARRAREEAEQLRGEASRLRSDARAEANRLREKAREMERRLRHEARDHLREERHAGPGPRPRPAPGRPWGLDHGPEPDEGDGVRNEEAFSLDGVKHVLIDQTAGKVLVRLCDEAETPGAVSTGSKSAPRLEVARTGDRLIVSVKLSVGWLFRRKQGATTVVRLAPGLELLKVNVGYGTVQLRDIEATLIKLDVGAGDIQCYSTHGQVNANLGAGKIALYDHHGLASCDSGTGDVLMDIAEVAEGEYRANGGIGRVEVRLPPDKDIKVTVESGLGRTRNEYPSAGGEARIRATINTGVGEAIVRARQMDKEPARPPAAARPQRPGRAAPARRHEAEELRVLQLLEQGRISSQEAAELIAALQGLPRPEEEEGLRTED